MAQNTVPILNAAPPWQPNLSDYLELWHGTTALHKNKIEKHGIDLAQCAVDTDFGRGFYTTTYEQQARFWAWERFYDWQARNPSGTANQPVILYFRVPRYTTSKRDGLDKLLSLHFVRGDYDNEDFWSLVQHCRQSIPKNTAKKIAEVEYNHRCGKGGWCQMVSGPAAAFWRQRVAMADADQFSFHKGDIDLLQDLIDKGKGKGVDKRGDPDYYQWSVVT